MSDPATERAAARADYLRRLGVALSKMRLAAGVTQADVAERLRIDPVTVSRWENGHYPPDAWELAEMVAMYEPPAEVALAVFRPPTVPVHDLDALLAERTARATAQKAGRQPKPPAKRTGASLRVVGRPRRQPRSGRGSK